MKTSLVLGASPNPKRYSYQATKMLKDYGYPVYPIGIRKGEIAGIKIINNYSNITDVHTLTLYLGADVQEDYYDFILKLQPKRIIFNPGTENSALIKLLKEKASQTQIEIACTLVMLQTGQY